MRMLYARVKTNTGKILEDMRKNSDYKTLEIEYN